MIRKTPSFAQFASIIRNNKHILLLNLSANNIGDEDSQVIFKNLLQNRSLTHLDMSVNGITSKGAIALSYAVSQPESPLHYVNLKDNPIGSAGCFSLISAIRNCAVRQSNPNPNPSGDPSFLLFSSAGEMTVIDFDLSPAINREDSRGIFNENFIFAHSTRYSLDLSSPYEFAVAQYLCQPSSQPSQPFWLLSAVGSNPLATVSNAKYKDAKGITLDTLVLSRGDHNNPNPASPGKKSQLNNEKGEQFPIDTKTRHAISDITRRLATCLESFSLYNSTHSNPTEKSLEAKNYLVDLFSKHFKISSDIILSISDSIIDQLLAVPPEKRKLLEIVFVITARSIYRHLLQLTFLAAKRKYNMRNRQTDKIKTIDKYKNDIDLDILQTHLRLIGFEDSINNFGKIYTHSEYTLRLISEVNIYSIRGSKAADIASAEKISHSVNLTEACFIQLLLSHAMRIYSYDLIPTALTSKSQNGGNTPFNLPQSGTIQFDLTLPKMIPSQQRVMSNKAFSLFLRSITGNLKHERDILRHTKSKAQAIESNFDKILFILTSTMDRVLNLTCDQAEVLLIQMFTMKILTFADLAERLLFQLADSSHVCSFLTRNFFFHEVTFFFVY